MKIWQKIHFGLALLMDRITRIEINEKFSPHFFRDEITASFCRFGPLVVDWPHKAESKSYFPPKGYAFLLFQVSQLSLYMHLELIKIHTRMLY